MQKMAVPLITMIAAAVAGVATQSLMGYLVKRLAATPGEQPHFLISPPGSTFTLAAIFVVVWCLACALLIIPYALWQRRRSS